MRNIILLPKMFSRIFTNPRCTRLALDILMLTIQNGVNGDIVMTIPKGYCLSYIKNIIVPFLKKLKIEASDNVALFDFIKYRTGRGIVSYQFSNYVRKQFNDIQPNRSKNGDLVRSKSYIIFNITEFLALKGIYAKQLYLSLCMWQKGQVLDLYRTGDQSVFKLWKVPKSYDDCFVSKILKPCISQINDVTNLYVDEIETCNNKYRILYKRLSRKKKKEVVLNAKKDGKQLEVPVNHYPYVSKSPLNYGPTSFPCRNPWRDRRDDRLTKKEVIPSLNLTAQAYYLELIGLGFDKSKATDYTNKKYRLDSIS